MLFLLASCSYGQKRVSQDEFKKLMKDKSAQILDVRTANEVAQGRIQGAINIDYFKADFKKVYDLEGGYDNWKE